jgi:hypothetical protein
MSVGGALGAPAKRAAPPLVERAVRPWPNRSFDLEPARVALYGAPGMRE